MTQLKSCVSLAAFFTFLTLIACEEKTWTCGSGGMSEKFSEFLASAICADRKEASNECCRVHDLCYENQEGQEKCDNDFCTCLQDKVIAPKPTSSGNKTQELVYDILSCDAADKMCALVKNFGEAAYDEAGRIKSGRNAALKNAPINNIFSAVATNSVILFSMIFI